MSSAAQEKRNPLFKNRHERKLQILDRKLLFILINLKALSLFSDDTLSLQNTLDLFSLDVYLRKCKFSGAFEYIKPDS